MPREGFSSSQEEKKPEPKKSNGLFGRRLRAVAAATFLAGGGLGLGKLVSDNKEVRGERTIAVENQKKETQEKEKMTLDRVRLFSRTGDYSNTIDRDINELYESRNPEAVDTLISIIDGGKHVDTRMVHDALQVVLSIERNIKNDYLREKINKGEEKILLPERDPRITRLLIGLLNGRRPEFVSDPASNYNKFTGITNYEGELMFRTVKHALMDRGDDGISAVKQYEQARDTKVQMGQSRS